MTQNLERKIDDVIDALKHSRNSSARCSLLIGAGCSVTAGIATAAGFVDLIKQRFKAAFDRASDKTYPSCMAELVRGHQRDLINDQVSKARINWAHMAIAQLIRNGYVDRVLTTNFDPLVLRACAMLGEFPAVYDFATSQLFRPGELPEKAIFHLHGQSTGFVLMNTEKDVNDHSEWLGPLFKDAVQARPWIVVGYSGDSDPVFNHLAAVEHFAYGLFWVGFKEEDPKAHVRDKLLQPGKDAYLVRGYEADRFFVELAQKLECFPPEFVQRPFSFLKSSLSTLTGYRQVLGDKEIDILHDVRDRISRAIAQFEEVAPNTDSHIAHAPAPSHEAIELAATALLMVAKYEDLERLQSTLGGDQLTASLRDTFAWAHIMHGIALSDQAKTTSGAEADTLFAAAGEKYDAALKIKPEMHEALVAWGVALSEQAKRKGDAQADRLFAAAVEKYEAALALKPDNYRTLSNWGLTLSDQAKTKSGAEVDRLFMAANENYAAALALKPDDYGALNNWGLALSAQARAKRGTEADALFAAAGEKYAAALTIKQEWHEALNNWGSLLLSWSAAKTAEQAERMLNEAEAKLLAAEGIRTGSAAYNLACVAARRGDATSCQEWLQRSQENATLPDRQHLLADPDLASVRNQPWFRRFLEGD